MRTPWGDFSIPGDQTPVWTYRHLTRGDFVITMRDDERFVALHDGEDVLDGSVWTAQQALDDLCGLFPVSNSFNEWDFEFVSF